MHEHRSHGGRLEAAARFTLAVAILLLSLAVSQARAASTAAASVYTDSSGDSKSAPDITQVTLTPNADGSAVALDIPLGSDRFENDGILVVELDTDRNRATGDEMGGEFVIVVGSRGLFIARGSDHSSFDHHALDATLSGGHLQLTLTLSDLGVTSFDFTVLTGRGNDVDAAPDDLPAFTYPQAVSTPAAPAAAQIRSVILPAGALFPKAGSQLRIPSLQVTLTDDTIVTADTLMCSLSFRGKPLAPSAPCTWKIPKSYRSKKLMLSVHVGYHGSTSDLTIPVVPR
jgi:hypothetical protein